jgi:hypothetical protein
LACGGDVRGRWEVISSCLAAGDKFDLTLLNIGCTEADVWGDLQVRGELEFLENDRFLDETITSGDLALQFAPECLNPSYASFTCEEMGLMIASIGFVSARCLDAPSGGCLCAAHLERTGGMGHFSFFPSTSGRYYSEDETLTLSDGGDAEYTYCVADDSLVASPTGMRPFLTTHGTVALERIP